MCHIGGADDIGVYNEALHAFTPLSSLADKRKRPELLSLGLFADHCNGNHHEEHRACQCRSSVPASHRFLRVNDLYCLIRCRSLHWTLLSEYGQCGSITRTKEYGIRHLDCLHLSEPLVFRRTGMLYPLAKYHQQH